MKDVVIIGAGIAGLSAGFEFFKNDLDFQLLDTSTRVGGNIETLDINDCLIETGPSTFSSLSTETLDLIRELRIEDSLIEAGPNAKKRYIYLNAKLQPIPTNLIELYKTELLSKDAKWTLFEELFIDKQEKEETVEDFISRRLGREVLKNIIQPFLNGVYAGDVKKLSASAVFPKLKNLENNYKSIILGSLFSRNAFKKIILHSFKEGMEKLPIELFNRLKNKVTLGIQDLEISRAKDFFIVKFRSNNKIINYTTSSILFAIPAHRVTSFDHLIPDYAKEALNIEYSPVATVTQIIDNSKLKVELDGFGVLCTKEPHRKLLGTLLMSSIFSDRAPKDKALLTSYIGGAHYKRLTEQKEEEISNLVAKEVAEILHISDLDSIETLNIKINPYAIPQYHLGHFDKIRKLEKLMDTNFGVFFTGNYLYGISINDTIKTSKTVAEKVKMFLNLQKANTKNQKTENKPEILSKL